MTYKKNCPAQGSDAEKLSKKMLERLKFYPSNDAYYNRLRQVFTK